MVSRDEATGKLLWQRVRTTSMNETDELVAVSLSDNSGRIVERIEATAEHPFFTTRGQVKAGDLGIGTQIIPRAGPTLTIASVERVKQGQTVPVFNFEVEDREDSGTEGDGHSYFVGNALGGVWVHNGKDCNWIRPPGWRLPKNGTWTETPGNSDFIPADHASLGLKLGENVPFVKGEIDLSQWAVETHNVKGLTGVHKIDMPLIHEHLAEQKGFFKKNGKPNATAAEAWLAQFEHVAHHHGGEVVHIVPGRLHGLSGKYNGIRHMGSAFNLRTTK